MIKNKISIGTAQFGMNYGIANSEGKLNLIELNDVFRFMSKNNIFSLDTAKAYGDSEKVIGQQLYNYNKEKWNITTKFSNPKNVTLQYKDSVNKLGVLPSNVLAHSVIEYTNNEFIKELVELKRKGKIKKIGLSLYKLDQIDKAIDCFVPDIIQLPLNILDNHLYKNGILDRLKSLDIEIHARSIFLQGLFYLPMNIIEKNFKDALNVINELKKIANRENLSLGELSLLWVHSLDIIDQIVIGIDNVNQLKFHINTLKKNIDSEIFRQALEIEYMNDNITNPSNWSVV